jgi:hypothetical protein
MMYVRALTEAECQELKRLRRLSTPTARQSGRTRAAAAGSSVTRSRPGSIASAVCLHVLSLFPKNL